MCCMLCVEYEKGKMKPQEVLNAIGEMIDSDNTDDEKREHLFGLADKVMDKEFPLDDWDDDGGFINHIDYDLDFGTDD